MHKKIVSFVLILTILLQLGSPAFAQVSPEATHSAALSAQATNDTSDLPYVIREDTALREEFSKTFLLSDGSYLVATYSSAVHQQAADGNWEQINNSLTETAALSNSSGESVYKTTSETSSLDVAFNASLAPISAALS